MVPEGAMPGGNAAQQIGELLRGDLRLRSEETCPARAEHVLEEQDRAPAARVDCGEVAVRGLDLEARADISVEARLALDEPAKTEHEPLGERRGALDEHLLRQPCSRPSVVVGDSERSSARRPDAATRCSDRRHRRAGNRTAQRDREPLGIGIGGSTGDLRSAAESSEQSLRRLSESDLTDPDERRGLRRSRRLGAWLSRSCQASRHDPQYRCDDGSRSGTPQHRSQRACPSRPGWRSSARLMRAPARLERRSGRIEISDEQQPARMCRLSARGVARHGRQRRGRKHLLRAALHEPLELTVHDARISRRLSDRPAGASARLPSSPIKRQCEDEGGDAERRRDGKRDAADRAGGQLPRGEVRPAHRCRPARLPAERQGFAPGALPLRRLRSSRSALPRSRAGPPRALTAAQPVLAPPLQSSECPRQDSNLRPSD